MNDSTLLRANPKWMTWTGLIFSALPVLMLVMSGVMKIKQPKEVVEGFGHLGYSMDSARVLAVIELGCTLIYLIPQTAVLGAILLRAISAARRQRICGSAILSGRSSLRFL